MKVAFTTSGDNLDAPFESRFGRAPKFLVYDLEKDSFSVIDNRQTMNAAQGAGIQSAQTIARAGAGCIVSGHCGPNAYRVLSAAGIKIFTASTATVREALEQFRTGKLVESNSADVDGHWI
jgi:predicted Fe-Mo cluster-binding NifX family protein